MYIVAVDDPVAVLRAEARRARGRAWPVRLCQALVTAWVRHLERRMERVVTRAGHEGVLEDFRRAARGAR